MERDQTQNSSHQGLSRVHAVLVSVLLVCGTVVGLTGIELLLPAVPDLSDYLGGTSAQAQYVLAAYVGGSALGLLAFGSWVTRLGRRKLLFGAMLLFGATSLLATKVPDLTSLIILRAFQGFAGAAPAVFAPAIIKQLFRESVAVRVIGMLGGIESLVPALAPLVGAWLLTFSDWRAGFTVTGVAGLVVAGGALLLYGKIPHQQTPTALEGPKVTYGQLIKNPRFIRYAVSQATVLGGLLIFVFGAPVMYVKGLDGSLSDFIRMQLMGIPCFIIASSTSDRLVAKIGAEQTMRVGTLLSATGALLTLAYALAGGQDPLPVAFCFVLVNLGLGMRGPVGFLFAMKAARGADDKGASLTMLAIMAVSSLGTAFIAPYVASGLLPLAAVAALVHVAGLMLFFFLPQLEDVPSDPAPPASGS